MNINLLIRASFFFLSCGGGGIKFISFSFMKPTLYSVSDNTENRSAKKDQISPGVIYGHFTHVFAKVMNPLLPVLYPSYSQMTKRYRHDCWRGSINPFPWPTQQVQVVAVLARSSYCQFMTTYIIPQQAYKNGNREDHKTDKTEQD